MRIQVGQKVEAGSAGEDVFVVGSVVVVVVGFGSVVVVVVGCVGGAGPAGAGADWSSCCPQAQ